jgi:hypothetical protein
MNLALYKFRRLGAVAGGQEMLHGGFEIACPDQPGCCPPVQLGHKVGA